MPHLLKCEVHGVLQTSDYHCRRQCWRWADRSSPPTSSRWRPMVTLSIYKPQVSSLGYQGRAFPLDQCSPCLLSFSADAVESHGGEVWTARSPIRVNGQAWAVTGHSSITPYKWKGTVSSPQVLGRKG